MKKLSFANIRAIISILLVLVAFAIVVPLHKKLVFSADNFTSKLLDTVEKQTQLKISYKSLSPSILSNFNINEISVVDSENNEMLLINKVKVNYKLFKLLKLDIANGITSIVIDGIDLDLDKLLGFLQTFQFTPKENVQIDIETIKSFIPSNIKLKNINLTYNDKKASCGLNVKDISVTNSNSESFSFSINSIAKANLLNINQTLSCGLNLSGTIYTSLENSNVTIKFHDITNGNIKLAKLCLFAEYKNNSITVNTIQTVNPIYIAASYNMESQMGSAQIKTENLNALSLVSVNSNQKKLKKFKNFTIDTNTSASISLKDLKNPVFNFDSKGKFFVPEELFPGTATIDYSLKGNQKELQVNSLSINGERCSGDVELTLIYKNLQLSGLIQLPYYILPNGNTVSTEIYFDPLNKGFMIFSPQTFIGEKALTAIQGSIIPEQDSYDFMLEAYDYSHFSDGEPGLIKIEGSYLTLSQYIQTNLAMNSLYLDSIVDYAIQVLDDKTSSQLVKVKEKLSPYIFSADTYISTDLKSVSYSVPYILLANTQQDNQVLMVSANGNEQSVQLDSLSLVYGKYGLEASGSLDIDKESKDMFYTADLNFASIPYHFSGNVMKEMITLTGDYGIDARVNFNQEKNINGYALIENLPFSLGTDSFIFTLDSSFNYDLENGPNVNINRISLEQASSNSTVSPKVIASGNINKYGAQISSITYTDYYSTLEGTADVMLNINENVFDSVGLIVNVKNPRSDEKIGVEVTVSNPEHAALDSDNLLKVLYLDSQVQINNFSLNRIAKNSHENNTLTASLFATGTMEHPYVALNVEKMNMLLSAVFWEFSGIATLEDKNVSIQDFKVSCPGMGINKINADFSLDEFTGKAGAVLEFGDAVSNLYLPLDVVVENTVMPEKGFLPDMFSATASIHDVSGTLVKKPFELTVGALYSDKVINLFTDDKIGASGKFTMDGKLSAKMKNDLASVNIAGYFTEKESEIKFSDIYLELKPFLDYLNFDNTFVVKEGIVKGTFGFRGDLDDPDFIGALVVENPRVFLPTVFKSDLTTSKILVTAVNNVIEVHDNDYFLNGQKKVQANLSVFFNKWSLDHISCNTRSYQNEFVPFNLNFGFFKIVGNLIANLDWYFGPEDKFMSVTGKIFAENADIVSAISDISQAIPASGATQEQNAVFADMEISIGTHVSLIFNPLLRAVFVPNTKIALKVDTDSGLYQVDGELNLKSGDVAYLNRNFYIKKGNIKFNPADLSNPLVSLRAETRERDDDGNNIKIILSAENQYLKDLNPRFYAEPAKSELEIQQLLGQIVAADSNRASSFIAAASDYALQSVLFRRTENKLRDLMNFDILSLRTNVLQNSVDMYNNSFTKQRVGIGNLLDNSTVYIGKYIGSSLYLDAMLQVQFEDNIQDITAPGALLFQPDFGMELESPFGNIRWNMSPNINALMHNQFVPSTSVSVSWKFSF